MREQFTGIESLVHFEVFRPKVTLPGSQEVFDTPTAMAITDTSFFTVFNAYEWIAGSPDVLMRPHEVVLTERSAMRYFGSADPDQVMGKQLIYRDSLEVTVGGLVKDLPFNTDIDFSDFMGVVTVEQSWLKKSLYYEPTDWTSVNSSTQVFFKLSPGTDIAHIQEQIPVLTKAYEENSTWGNTTNQFSLQPLSDLHFNSDTGIFDHTKRAPAHLSTLTALMAVAVLLLVIGAINFINLETAQSLRRAKEVGIRKVLGSSRATLVAQFISESLLITLFAVVLALPLAELSLRYFSEFVPEGVTLRIIEILPVLLALVLGIGILAGLYPAVVLSSFIPVRALKSQSHADIKYSSPAFLRKALIVFQFTFAQVLILGAFVVNKQLSFMINKDLGFKKDAVIYFDGPWWEKSDKVQALKNELAQIAEVEQISMSDAPPSYPGWSSSYVTFKENNQDIQLNAYRKFGDSNYIDFYGIQLVAGRNLQPSDTVKEFLINETMSRMLGFENPEEAIGHKLGYGNDKTYPIVGVVKDFHIQSLHKAVEPVMLANEEKNFSCFNLKFPISENGIVNLTSGLKKVEAAWKKIYPEAPFEHYFLDETLRNFYKAEQRTAKITNLATALAILISCLGLFGLVSYTTLQRTKEIGIRKVLGASVNQIVFLLSKSFLSLVLIAFVVGAPLAWYFSESWLKGFTYRITPGFGLFAITALAGLLIAFITLSAKTIQAAQANPADSLRTE
jgi:putative ABC transport system permease protein